MTDTIFTPEIKVKLTYKKNVSPEKLFMIKSVDDAYEVFKRLFNADTFNWSEEVILLCLNTAHKLVGFYKVSSGGMTETLIDPRIIFSVALNCGATSIMLAHNHPSGNLTPSKADIVATNKITSAGQLLNIKLLDHLIVSSEGFYSFAESGML